MVLVAMIPLLAGARTVWSGSQKLDWNNSKYVQVNASSLGSVKAGDKVVLTFASNDLAQIQFVGLDGSWNTFENRSLAKGSTESQFYLTNDMVSKIIDGIAVSGINVTLTQIDVEEGDGTDYSNSVWIGETAIAKDWSNWQMVDKSFFANAVENCYIRFKFKDVFSGAQFGLQYNNGSTWKTMPGVANVNISGLYQQYTISREMLRILQTYGCIVRGGGYTLTGIDIIDPSTLKTLTLSVASDGTNSNWAYSTSKPTIKISVKNDNDKAVTANAMLRVYTDSYESYQTVRQSTIVAAKSSQTISLTLSDVAAGFYRVYATVNDEMARPAFVIGVNPTSIVSTVDKQADFNVFWQTAKEQLAAIEANDTPIFTELNGENGTANKSTSARKVYLVQFQSIPDGTSGNPITVRGYYCEPTDGKKHPVIMHYLGYDSSYAPGGTDYKPYCPSGDANPHYAEFYLSTRGQSLNNRAHNEREADGLGDFTNIYGDWFAYNFGKKDSWYYRGAYMDCVRAIDFMATRETSDMNQLFAEGQSQGGALTYAAAALSGRTFRAIAPAITFMGDFPDYFRRASWPANVANANQGNMTDAEMYAFLSYFDTKNLAANVSCPLITSIGLQDNVCPPHTNIAPYNNATTALTDKKIVFNAELAHQVNDQWFTNYNNFFKKYENTFESNKDVLWEGISNQTNNSWTTYCTIDSDKAKTLKAGDRVAVTVSASSKEKSKWPSVNLYSGSTSLGHPYAFWNEVDNNTDFPVTKEEYLSQADINLIQSSGLKLSGGGCTLTKVVRVPFNPVLWEGKSETVSWNAAYTVPEMLVKDFAVGDTLRITIASSDFVAGCLPSGFVPR